MRIVLLGGGGLASCVLEALGWIPQEFGPLTVLGILADGEVSPKRFDGRTTHLGTTGDVAKTDATHFIPCSGFPQGRRNLTKIGLDAGLKPYRLVHPTVICEAAKVGRGAIVLAGTIFAPKVSLGNFGFVGHGVVIEHDTVVGENTSVMSRAFIGGDVSIGSDCLIGANATILQGLTLGDGCVVGAGSVVTKDVPPGTTVLGSPAKPR